MERLEKMKKISALILILGLLAGTVYFFFGSTHTSRQENKIPESTNQTVVSAVPHRDSLRDRLDAEILAQEENDAEMKTFHSSTNSLKRP
ncbi:MAG: hypothetical protein ACR2H1_09910 [Limisphaerales bacterium]